MKQFSILRIVVLAILTANISMAMSAKDNMHYRRYTVKDGLPHRVITRITQDTTGYIWLSTYNGLCRFDGEQFKAYNLTTDGQKIGRISDVCATSDNRIWITRDSDEQEFFFNRETQLFEPLCETIKVEPITAALTADRNYADKDGLHIIHNSDQYDIPYQDTHYNSNSRHLSMTDMQGNLWVSFDDALYCITFSKTPFGEIRFIDPQNESLGCFDDEIRAMIKLNNGGFLLACKNTYIYKYNNESEFEGWLSPDGRVSSRKVSFGTRIYAMHQDDAGTVWLGSREDGLYRITSPQLDTIASAQRLPVRISHFTTPLLNSDKIYDICPADSSNLIIATWRSGIQKLRVMPDGTVERNGENQDMSKVRYIYPVSKKFYALCCKTGLYFLDNSLNTVHNTGSGDFTNILLSDDSTYYASSLSNGVFTFRLPANPTIDDIKGITLKPFNVPELDYDILTMAKTPDGALRFVSDNGITRFNTRDGNTTHFDQSKWQKQILFGEAEPIHTDDAVILGTTEGICVIQSTIMQSYQAPICLNCADTLTVNWKEDMPEIHAVTIDYRQPRIMQYAWRISPDTVWNYHTNNCTFKVPELWPGRYVIEIRSTDARGNWTDNTHTICLNVRITRLQWLQFAVLLLILIATPVVIWKLRHPKIVKKIEKPVISGIQPVQPVIEGRDMQFIEGVTHAVEQNISDPDLDVEKLAQYMNISRTILYNRFKETLNTTPANFISEFRMKRAIQLLTAGQYRVSEVATMCGFTDAKYFARIFKQKMGVTPVKYLNRGKDDDVNT